MNLVKVDSDLFANPASWVSFKKIQSVNLYNEKYQDLLKDDELASGIAISYKNSNHRRYFNFIEKKSLKEAEEILDKFVLHLNGTLDETNSIF